jgi:hypothetical protein
MNLSLVAKAAGLNVYIAEPPYGKMSAKADRRLAGE